MKLSLVIVLGAAGLAGACATEPRPEKQASSELQQMTQECAARKGMLVPSPGVSTGRDRIDYVCDIKSAGGRLE